MKRTEEFLEKKIRWKIDRGYTINKNTISFENWNRDTQIRFDSVIGFEDIGNPILLFLGENHTWVILGSKRLIAGNENTLNSLEYNNLEKFDYGYLEKENPIKSRIRKLMLYGPKPTSLLIKEKGKSSFVIPGLRFEEICNLGSILLMIERLITPKENIQG